MTKCYRSLLMAVLILTTNAVFAWGQNGHRIIGKIAENHITDATRDSLQPLLNGDQLAAITTWADEMRSNPSPFWQKQSGKWHYININSADEFKPAHYHVPVSKKDVTDIYSAIMKSVAILSSQTASIEEKRFYLRMLTHLVGDIHQPLHAGRAEDWGGNKIKITFFDKDTNLHSLWDTDLIESENLSFTEFAHFINTQDAKVIQKHVKTQPKEWVLESFYLAQDLYETGNGEFSYSYVYKAMPIVKKRLLQGGIRLAGLLNFIFDKSANVQVNASQLLEHNNK